MRVILDTNVLVAAFVARGVCADVLERVVADHDLILSPHIVGEFQRVMTHKLGFDSDRVNRALALLLRFALIEDPEPLEKPVCRDEDDDAVLALVRSAGARCLITGDEDILSLEAFHETPIISPREFLTFNPGGGSG